MSEVWQILDAEEVAEMEKSGRAAKMDRYERLHCLCGRFAKWVSDQHYYNGQFDCYRYTVRCSRCGDVDIECV